MATVPQKYLFDVEIYHQMIEANIFLPNTRVELIEGEIIKMAAMGPIHAAIVTNIAEFWYPMIGKLATVRVQMPITLGDLSEPEPDIVLARRYAHGYREKHPSTEDIWLLIEVADSSLTYDQETKIPLYAKYGIQEVWIVEVKNTWIKVYQEPTIQGYAKIECFELGEQITPLAFPKIQIKVDEIF
jgi:Uma2 family endonuclease